MIRRLDELPEELVSNISARLHADDISALRLSCRALEHKTFHEFATEYFTEKGFVITTDSLKVLVAIANSEKLNGYLQNVHFLTAFFAETKCPNGCNCAWRPSVKQAEAFRTYLADQKSIKKTGSDKDMLQEAFAALPALKAVTIVDSPSVLPKDVDYRGKNRIRRLTGREPMFVPQPEDDKLYDRFVRHVWKIVMEALAGSKPTTLSLLGGQITRGIHGISPAPDMAHIGLSEMKPVFANLETLSLRMRTNNAFKKGTEASIKKEKSDGARAMKAAAKAMPMLSVLDLTFDSGPSSGLYFVRFANNLNLDHLSKLYLRSLYIQAASLGPIICKLRSVKDLRLTFVNLTKGNWVSILKAIQTLTNHLTHLHLMYLMEAEQKAYFLKQSDREDVNGNDFLSGDFMDDDDDDDISVDEESASDTDDDLPALEPIDGSVDIELEPASDVLPVPQLQTPIIPQFDDEAVNPPEPDMPLDQFIEQAPSDPIVLDSSAQDKEQDDFIAPNDPGHGERGYYVCLKDGQIAAQLPKFIEEYNLGDDIGNELDGLGGFDNLLHSLGNALGVGPPPGGPLGGVHGPPPPPAAAGNTGNHAANTTANTTASTAAAANGIVPTGNGGYATHLGNGIILGTGPLPPFLGPTATGPPPPAATAAPAAPPTQTIGTQQGVGTPGDLLQQLLYNFPTGAEGGVWPAHPSDEDDLVDDMD